MNRLEVVSLFVLMCNVRHGSKGLQKKKRMQVDGLVEGKEGKKMFLNSNSNSNQADDQQAFSVIKLFTDLFWRVRYI